METQYEQFIKRMKDLGASKPYMSENEYNSFHGIEQEAVIEPLQVRPKKDRKPIATTHENYEKVEA